MMSSESLSQQEIDLLFGGAGPAETAPSDDRSSHGDIQVYDFRRPSRISKDHQRTLEGMYGRMTKALESWLVGRVRSQIEVQLLAVEQFSFGEFQLSLMTPCNSFIFDISNRGGHQGVIDFGRDLSFFLVDRFLGGNGRIGVPDRSLTTLERMIVRIAADQLLAQIREIWEELVPLDLEISRFEMVPDMLQIANREDPVLVANVELSNEYFRSNILICLPFVVLEGFFTGPGPRRVTSVVMGDAERVADRVASEELVRFAEVGVSARFPSISLSMRELLELGAGSLLATGIPTDTELELLIENVPLYRAVAGRSGNALAVRIRESIGVKGQREMEELITSSTSPTDGGETDE